MRYKFFCPICKKEISRKEVMPVVQGCEVTPKGYPRMVIYRAFHFPNCKGNGDLQITVIEKKSKDIQNKLGYNYDEQKSGRDIQDKNQERLTL